MARKLFTKEEIDKNYCFEFIITYQKHQDYGVALYNVGTEVWGFEAVKDYENGVEILDYEATRYIEKPVTTLTWCPTE